MRVDTSISIPMALVSLFPICAHIHTRNWTCRTCYRQTSRWQVPGGLDASPPTGLHEAVLSHRSIKLPITILVDGVSSCGHLTLFHSLPQSQCVRRQCTS